MSWNDLRTAIDIFESKVPDLTYPFGCEHDILHVYVSPELFSLVELSTLESLGFHTDEAFDAFYSFKYGSA